MSIITVIGAQASLYYSQLITALGLTGATAIGQAFVLTMLAVVSIIAIVAAGAAIYYGAKGISHGFIKLNSWWKSDKTKIPKKKKAPKIESDNDDVASDIDSDLESGAPVPPKEVATPKKSVIPKKNAVPELGSDSESESASEPASKSEKILPPKKPLTPAKKDSEVADPDLVYLNQMDDFLNQFITDVENFNSTTPAANKDKLDNTEYKKAQKEVKELILSKDKRTSERLEKVKEIQATLVESISSILADQNKKSFKDFVGADKYEALTKPLLKEAQVADDKPKAKEPEEESPEDLRSPFKPKIKSKNSEFRKQPSQRKFCDKPANGEVVNLEENQKIDAYYEVFAKTLEPKLFQGMYKQAQEKNAFIFYNDKGEIKLFCKENFLKNYTVLLGRAQAKVPKQESKPDVAQAIADEGATKGKKVKAKA